GGGSPPCCGAAGHISTNWESARGRCQADGPWGWAGATNGAFAAFGARQACRRAPAELRLHVSGPGGVNAGVFFVWARTRPVANWSRDRFRVVPAWTNFKCPVFTYRLVFASPSPGTIRRGQTLHDARSSRDREPFAIRRRLELRQLRHLDAVAAKKRERFPGELVGNASRPDLKCTWPGRSRRCASRRGSGTPIRRVRAPRLVNSRVCQAVEPASAWQRRNPGSPMRDPGFTMRD